MMKEELSELESHLDKLFQVQFHSNAGLEVAEPIFVEIARLLGRNHAARERFIEMASHEISVGGSVVSELASRPKGFVDGDLICFIAHMYRWPEFASAIEQRVRSVQHTDILPGSRDLADLVCEALREDWEDRDLYDSFRD